MAEHFHGGYSHDHDEAGYHEHTGYNTTEPDAALELAEPAPVEEPAAVEAERQDGITERTEAETAAAVAIAEANADAAVAIAEADADAAVAIAEADADARIAEAGGTPPTLDDVDHVDDDGVPIVDHVDAIADQVADQVADALDDVDDVDELPSAGDVVEITVPPQADDPAGAAAAAGGDVAVRRGRHSRLSRRRR